MRLASKAEKGEGREGKQKQTTTKKGNEPMYLFGQTSCCLNHFLTKSTVRTQNGGSVDLVNLEHWRTSSAK